MAESFGLWTVIGSAPSLKRRGSGVVPHVLARCACGTKRRVSLPNLKSSKSRSCGYYKRKRTAAARIRHGESRKGAVTAEYSCWQSMLRRCLSPSHSNYGSYGGRGIRVTERWLKFEHFLADLGRRPTSAHSLDRINVNGNYEPGNCRWATSAEQRRNQRPRLRLEQFSDSDLLSECHRHQLLPTVFSLGSLNQGAPA